jgi:hypothetical protein
VLLTAATAAATLLLLLLPLLLLPVLLMSGETTQLRHTLVASDRGDAQIQHKRHPHQDARA